VALAALAPAASARDQIVPSFDGTPLFLTEFSELVLMVPNASLDAKPSRPSAAAVVPTSVRRVCADSCEFCRSIVSKR
jgi:hypothetical protein